jgi:hypothetical protein
LAGPGPAPWRTAAGRTTAWQCSSAATWQRPQLLHGRPPTSPPPTAPPSPLLPLFFFSPGPFFFFSSRTSSSGRRLTPAGCHGLGAGAAALASPTGGLQRSFPSQLLLLPLSPSLLAMVRGESPMGGGAATGRGIGRGFKGRLLGFGWREWAAGIPFRGTRRPSRGASAAGQGRHGWRRPWGRRGSPPCVRHGGEERQGKDKEDG